MSEPGRRAVVALLLAGVVVGCRRPSGSAPSPSSFPSPAPPADAPLALPEVDGFAAGATTRADGYVRRTYTRDSARIDVTLARMPMSSDDYASWVKMSTASFPQAALALPAAEANGFYQCADGSQSSCDLLIQLRAGVHLELRGAGTSSRDDVDALARGVSLPTLAGRPAE
jgi:hypothetical protein